MNAIGPTAEAWGLRDISPPVDYALSGGAWIIWLVIVLAAVAGVWFMVWRRRARGIGPRPVTPRKAFVRSLADLSGGLESRRAGFFYQELCLAARVYLRDAFGIPAVDLTSAELAAAFDEGGSLPKEQKDALLAVLRRGDEVKFARTPVNAEQMREDLKTMIDWVEPEAPAG